MPGKKPTTPAPLSQQVLLKQWQERVQTGTFSPAVTMGLGTIRVMGMAGDATITYPRIESLAALDTLEPDERAAVEYAEQVVRVHQAAGRRILAPTATPGATLPTSRPLSRFDPSLADVVVTSMITGG